MSEQGDDDDKGQEEGVRRRVEEGPVDKPISAGDSLTRKRKAIAVY
jgi:hypothetical protein